MLTKANKYVVIYVDIYTWRKVIKNKGEIIMKRFLTLAVALMTIFSVAFNAAGESPEIKEAVKSFQPFN